MSWVMIILLLIASYLILVPLLTYLSAKRQIGQKVATDGQQAKDQLIYFYSDNCPPCKTMTPVIDELSERHDNISKIDVKRDPEAARAYKVRATPTLILVKDGFIDDILLGAKNASQLETLLSKIS
ncbi:MAG: thioredoxin family protein [Candidatus Thiodiazotropha sp. 6PLUC2]